MTVLTDENLIILNSNIPFMNTFFFRKEDLLKNSFINLIDNNCKELFTESIINMKKNNIDFENDKCILTV